MKRPCIYHYLQDQALHIVACQAHPALVKIGPALVPLFIFDSLLARIDSPRNVRDTYDTYFQWTVSHRGSEDCRFVETPPLWHATVYYK